MLGGVSGTLSLNTSNSNTWSALQTFNYSSSTVYSSFINASSTNLYTGFLTFSTSTAGTLKVNSSGLVYSDTSSSGSGYSTIADEGSNLTQRSILNFIGAGVSCIDNGGSTRTDCTFTSAGGSGGGSWSTTTSSVSGTLINYSNNDGDVISIGSNSTTSSEFWFDPNVLLSYFSGKMGIGSTTPWGQLSVNPNGIGGGVPEFVIGSSTETHFIVDGRGYVGIGTTSPYAHLSVVADDNLVNPAYFEGNVNSYFQLNLKNRSNGSSASTDFVATADIGTETTYYLDLGINNSKYTNSAQSSENALDGFLISSDGGLVLGTASSTNPYADIRFVTGGLASSSIKMVIQDSGLIGFGTTTPWALLSASTTSSNPLAVFDQRGTGGLLTLQSSGVDRFVVNNGGGLSIFADTADIVRTKTGTQGSNDFSRSGSTLTNVTSSNDQISIDAGTISGQGTIAATTTVTNVITGSGSQTILRADGKYVIIHGNGSATASLWNGRTNGTISALGVNVVSTGSVGAGAIALKRSNGRYQMVHGGGSAGLTSVFDPMGIAPTVAGAAACGAVAIATGTNAILRPDGNYLVLCGGFNSSSMFNPTSGTWTVGPTLSTGTYGAGSIALARDDGTFLIMPGNNTANTFVYSPYNTTTNIGTMTNVTISGAPTIGTSTVAIRRNDGKFLIIPGASGASYLYDPVRTQANPEGTFTSLGVGPSQTMGEGAQAIWRQDGKYLLLLGGTTVTNIVDPGAGNVLPTFITSGAPTLSATSGFGQTAFMLPDGRYAITLGGGTNTINTYDMNFVRGGDYNASTGGTGSEVATYETECIVNNNINPSSTLNWNANAEGALYFQVKMGSGGTCSGSYQNIIRSGDLIGAASTTNAVQVKVFFKRDLPVFIDQEWGLRRSYLTRYRRVNKDPALYDFSIDNGNLLHRTQFDFGTIVSTTTSSGQSNLASGPVSINIANNSDRNLGMTLIQGVGLSSGFNTTMSGVYNGAFASTTALTTGTATSTIVMKRPDGKFTILVGTTTNNAMVYDQVDGSITANATSPAQSIGLGAQAFKRPDGKFFIIYGNGSNGTSIYDPVANTFSVGTSTVGNVGEGSLIIPLPIGKILIVHGNASQTTSIYDPVQNTMIAGPATTAVVGPGAMAIPNADGTYMVAPGSATLTCAAISVTATMQFDPYTMMFTAAGTDGFTTNGPGRGGVAIQRKDGTWLIAKGAGGVGCYTATNITEVYNPVTKRFQGTGATLATAIGPGAMAIPRPDGNWLIFNGLAAGARTNTTNIYMPGDATAVSGGTEGQGAAVAGPVGLFTGVGAVSFQRDDGKFVIIGGAATSTSATDVALYDAGWVTQGYYRSEQIDMTGELDSNASLVWKSNGVRGISAEVRTAPTQAALGTSTPREIPTSGGNLGASVTDNWVSIMFNFKRNLPQDTGIFQDVNVSNLAGKYRMPYYIMDNPTMYEFKITKDKDLLNLQADGLSMFRVSSSGDIFASTGATINTSGADLAERYTSQETLDFGDVVTIDPMNNHAVKKSKYQYQTDMVGVVSTDPGFVSGAYTENSYPIGLIGRVPVKVSTENGIIHVGDYLTTSSVPGHAMKATLSGRVLGKALESMDESKLVDCPASDVYVPGRKCTTIMMFVNLIDYGGQSVDSAMSDWKTLKTAKLAQATLNSGLEFVSTTSTSTTAIVPSMTSHDAEVLSFLSELKAERANGVSSMSEILTDKVSAITQVISPEIISRIVKSEVIDGLEVRSEKVNTKALTTDTISGNGMTMSLVDGKLVIRGTKVISTSVSTSTVATSTLSSELANALSALELSTTRTAITIKAILSTAKLMEMASSFTRMVVSIKELSKMVSRKAMVSLTGWMAASMKVCGTRISTDMENTPQQRVR
jgi:hypothetical protein